MASQTDISAQPSSEAERSIEVLLDEGRYSFDTQGRLRKVYILKYRILRADVIDSNWSTVGTAWAPWHEARPEISATVTLPDGTRHVLAPETLEISGNKGDSTTFTDRQQIRGPLPALQVGALVESKIIIQETQPVFAGGSTANFYFSGNTLTHKAKLTVTAPTTLPLQYAVLGSAPQPTDVTKAGLRTLVFESTPAPDKPVRESTTPPSLRIHAQVMVSAAPSWIPIAKAYAKQVDERIAKAGPLEIDVPSQETRERTIEAVLSAVHGRIRYTGLEFGAASLIPAAPDEVLTRGYGDCKDKATLVVALLRKRGIEAQVALLRAGYRTDIVENVPSISHFNHAVVYVPGAEPLWLDATVEYQEIADIGRSLQGRQALIASPQTKGLIRIPELPAARNLYRETREVHLSDYGEARVVESTEGRGNMDLRLRGQYQDTKKKELTESLTKYAKRIYGAVKIEAINRSSTPYQTLSFTAVEADRLYVNVSEASIPLTMGVLFDWLPKAAISDKKDAPARTLPLYIYEPYRAELLYRIHLPQGFAPRAPLKAETTEMGPATLTRSWRQQGNVVEIEYSFETNKRTWSVEERATFISVYKDLQHEDTLLLDHQGALLMSEGRIQEGLALYRSLTSGNPKSAIQHARLSLALTSASFGMAARAAARQAVKLDPHSFLALHTLADTLAADAFGRELKLGMDRKGAIRAYEATLKEAPRSPSAHTALARLLSYSDHGMRYEQEADLSAAVAQYLETVDKHEVKDQSDQLLQTMLMAGQYEALKKRAEAAPAGAHRNALLVAAVAITEGAKRAVEVLRGLGATSKVDEVAQAANKFLLKCGKYQVAADLIEVTVGRNGLGGRNQVDLLRRLRPWAEVKKELTGPQRAVFDFLTGAIVANSPNDLHKYLSPTLKAEDERQGKSGMTRGFSEQSFQSYRYATPILTVRTNISTAFMLDSLTALSTLDQTGDDETGYHLKLISPNPDVKVAHFFVTKHGAKYRLRATEDMPTSLGAEAMSHLNRGNTKAALQWLDWAAATTAKSKSDDLQAGPNFQRYWAATKARDAKALGLGAAILMANAPATGKQAARSLRKHLGTEQGPQNNLIRASLEAALRLSGQWAKSLPLSRALHKQNNSETSRIIYVATLRALGRLDEAKAVIMSSNKDTAPGLADTARLVTIIGTHEAGVPEALALLQNQIDGGEVSSRMYNLYAWTAMYAKTLPKNALLYAERAASATKFNNAAILHTLGCIYAASNQPGRAMQAFLRLLEMKGARQPTGADWYLYGRIAEAHGLKDTARTAYKRVKRPPFPPARVHSAWVLAEQGLARLK